jgi:hypothetical protein
MLGFPVCFGRLNYNQLDLSIQDIRSGFAYLEHLPKDLRMVRFEVYHGRTEAHRKGTCA